MRLQGVSSCSSNRSSGPARSKSAPVWTNSYRHPHGCKSTPSKTRAAHACIVPRPPAVRGPPRWADCRVTCPRPCLAPCPFQGFARSWLLGSSVASPKRPPSAASCKRAPRVRLQHHQDRGARPLAAQRPRAASAASPSIRLLCHAITGHVAATHGPRRASVHSSSIQHRSRGRSAADPAVRTPGGAGERTWEVA